MKIEVLFNFIDSGLLPCDFPNSLKDEILAYRNAVLSQKGIKNIYGENDLEIIFGRKKLIPLLNYYLTNKILEWDLEYILNYIELSFEIFDEKVEEVVFSFSDPYLNFPITQNNIKRSISFLKDEIDSTKFELNENKKLREGYRTIFLPCDTKVSK